MDFLFPTYFPFCIYEGDEGDVGNGTPYPVGMSLENAMALYWKAKTFRITETWDVLTIYTGTTVVGTTDTILTPSLNLNKMSDLCCRPDLEATGRSGTFLITTPSQSSAQHSFQDYITLYLFQGDGVIFRNDLYYPQISLARAGGFYDYYNWLSSEFSTERYLATITINGNQYSFSMYSDHGSEQRYYNTTTNITIDSERTPD